jgi:hypothetical protein
MMYYEISESRGLWIIWKWTNNSQHCERFKSFKTRKGAENWAAKQWCQVIWR